MPNAKELSAPAYQNILLVGPTGSGKTSQIWTLPGKKFAYIFDPNSLASLQGCDLEYETFFPDIMELDSTVRGFNRDSKDRGQKSKLEPTRYLEFTTHLTEKAKEGYFKQFDWVCFDSITFLERLAMQRQLYINNRYGFVEDLSDYRCVGSKMSDLFTSILSEDVNIFCTGHVASYRDEKTSKVSTQLKLAGSGKDNIPLSMTNIWQAISQTEGEKRKFVIQTVPEKRGLQCIRSQVKGLKTFHDVTIEDFNNPENYGIGALLKGTK